MLHHCDNPQCTNPKHLFIGTISDNVRDMITKGRNVPTKGQRNFHCKHTPDEIREIRRLYATGDYLQRELAKMFNFLSISGVNQVINRKSWGWLSD